MKNPGPNLILRNVLSPGHVAAKPKQGFGISSVARSLARSLARGVTRLQDHVPEELILLFAVSRLWWLLDLALYPVGRGRALVHVFAFEANALVKRV